MCKNKETDSPSGTCTYRSEVTGDMLTIKGESWKKKKKNGTPIFWEWDSYFLKKGSPGLLLLKS